MRTLQESILSTSDLDTIIGNRMAEDELAEIARGKYKLKVDKTGAATINGDIVITTNKPQVLTVFKKIKGYISFEKCPNIRSLVGNFTKDCVAGTLNITSLPSLETLEGLPGTIGSLNLMDLPKIKRLDDLKACNITDISLSKMGKRFDQVKAQAQSGVEFDNIFCSLDEPAEEITEALSEIHLQKLDKALAGYGFVTGSPFKLSSVLSPFKMDQITPSMVKVIKPSDDKAKAVRSALSRLSRQDKWGGGMFILVYNAGDDVTPRGMVLTYANNTTIYYIKRDRKTILRSVYQKSQEAVNLVADSSGKVVIYSIDPALNTQDVRTARMNTKDALMKLHPDNVRAANQKRYKDGLAALKAKNLEESIQTALDNITKTMGIVKEMLDLKWNNTSYKLIYHDLCYNDFIGALHRYNDAVSDYKNIIDGEPNPESLTKRIRESLDKMEKNLRDFAKHYGSAK